MLTRHELDYGGCWIEIQLRPCMSPAGMQMYTADVKVSGEGPDAPHRPWATVQSAAFVAFHVADRALREGLTRGCAYVDAMGEQTAAD
jgi:hypothetical protein